MSAVINSTLLSAATARSSAGTSCRKKFPQLFAQPVYRETLSRREEQLNDRLGGDLPHPFRGYKSDIFWG